jgi:HK97 family phage major capsid protein
LLPLQLLDCLVADGAPRRGSRFVDQGASRSLVEHIAGGGTYELAGATPKRSTERRAASQGVAFGMKALAEGTGSAGGYLVPVEVADEIVKLLRARSAVLRLAPTTVPVEKELDITSLATGASAYWGR